MVLRLCVCAFRVTNPDERSIGDVAACPGALSVVRMPGVGRWVCARVRRGAALWWFQKLCL